MTKSTNRFVVPSNAEKAEVWKRYHDRNPLRVPLRWNVNPRIIVLNPELNPEGYTYEQCFHDPHVALVIQSRSWEYLIGTLSRTCDTSDELPEAWNFCVDNQNIYDAAYFGAEVRYQPGQVPCTCQSLTLDDVDAFLKRDFSRPLDNPWIRNRLAFHGELVREAKTFTHRGRKGNVAPFRVGFDGPLTVAANLFGSDIFLLLGMDPPKAGKLLTFITEACIVRNRAIAGLTGTWKKDDRGWLADDSIQLISSEMYAEIVLPIHELWYSEMSSTLPSDGRRSIHLCGDATRHFKMIHEKLGVTSFDTGFPVNHGALRRELGPDVEISGGPRISILKDGTPAECAEHVRLILRSGVMAGGRFILQEGNNLPPCVPLENLRAVYEVCLQPEFRYR